MATRGRDTGVQFNFNFDSLTDTVTNLSGTLILLVVLVLGLTRDVIPRTSGPVGRDGGPPKGKSIEPILRQVEEVRLKIRGVDQQIRQLETTIPELKQQLDGLPKAPATRASSSSVALSDHVVPGLGAGQAALASSTESYRGGQP